jgi:hypothetical protein
MTNPGLFKPLPEQIEVSIQPVEVIDMRVDANTVYKRLCVPGLLCFKGRACSGGKQNRQGGGACNRSQ